MVVGTVIYGISEDAVLRIRNSHGDSTSRPAAGPVLYGIFGDAAFEIRDTHEDSMSRAAKRLTLSRNRSLVRRFCRVLSVRWGTGSSVSRAARRFCIAGPQNHGTSESQVTQFACGTPVLAPRSVKTRDNGGPAGQKRPAARETDDLVPQRTDKTRQNRRTRLRFLDSVSLFAARDVESP